MPFSSLVCMITLDLLYVPQIPIKFFHYHDTQNVWNKYTIEIFPLEMTISKIYEEECMLIIQCGQPKGMYHFR